LTSNPELENSHEKTGGQITCRNFVTNPEKYRPALAALLMSVGSHANGRISMMLFPTLSETKSCLLCL
jgi:hypothetical protein